jgi:hypothetical protein
MQIRKKIKYSKDNNGQINIIYNIPDWLVFMKGGGIDA